MQVYSTVAILKKETGASLVDGCRSDRRVLGTFGVLFGADIGLGGWILAGLAPLMFTIIPSVSNQICCLEAPKKQVRLLSQSAPLASERANFEILKFLKF